MMCLIYNLDNVQYILYLIYTKVSYNVHHDYTYTTYLVDAVPLDLVGQPVCTPWGFMRCEYGA